MQNQIALAEYDTKSALDELLKAQIAHQKYLINQKIEDWNTAIECYVNAAKYNPELPEIYYRLAFLMWERGEIDVNMAIEQCELALKYSPECPNAYIYKGFFDRIASNYMDAEEEFKKAIDLTGFKSARPRLMLSLSILKRMGTQEVHFKDILKFLYYFISGSVMLSYDFPSLKVLLCSFKDDFSFFAYKQTGTFLENINMNKMACNLYDSAANKIGHGDIFYSRIGDIQLRSKNHMDAYLAYKNAYNANTKSKVNIMKLASLTQIYFPQMVDETIDYYNSLLELEPENSGFIYYELGHLYLKKEDRVNSISAFRLALEKDKTNPFYHNSLAYAYLKAELYEDAISHYTTAISINPDNEWTAIVCHALGSLYVEVYGNFYLAIDKYKEGINLDPKNSDIYISLGDVLMILNDIDGAIKTYCDAIKVAPDNYRAYSKAGLAFWEKNLIEEAMVSLHKSIELNPDFDIAQNNLGVIYLDGLGCASDALPLFERAIEINPSYTLAYFNAARACEILLNKTKAAEYYQMALDMNKLTQDLNEEEIRTRLHSLFEL